MKYLVVIAAGLTDRPIAEKDNKTPLQLAETPNLDALVKKGQCGPVQSIPDILKKISDEEGTMDGLSKLEVVMRKVFQYAVEGKPWAVQFIADRTEGKALERIDQTTRLEPFKLIER